MADSPLRGAGVVGPDTVGARGAHAVLLAAKRAKGLTFDQLAAAVGIDTLLLAAALTGQMPLGAKEAERLVATLEVDPTTASALEEIPARGARELLDDPTISRLLEVVMVWGPAIKAVIHERFGDGIMSAIDMTASLERVAHPDGDRVRLTLEGKFLPYRRF